MRKVFLLSKGHLDLAVHEVLSLTNAKDYELIDNLLILNTNFKDFSRLAYTKAIYNLLFIAYKNNLLDVMERFDWNSHYKKDFCIRQFNTQFKDKDLANYIWNNIKMCSG